MTVPLSSLKVAAAPTRPKMRLPPFQLARKRCEVARGE
jgi:hypothetical protein